MRHQRGGTGLSEAKGVLPKNKREKVQKMNDLQGIRTLNLLIGLSLVVKRWTLSYGKS